MYKKQYKTAYYQKLAEVGLNSVWFDKIVNGGSRSAGLFLKPERIPLTFIVQLAYTAKLPLEKCIETLWQHNIVGSPHFSNTEFKKSIPIVIPPSPAIYNKTLIKPYSNWYPPHLKGGLFAEKVYERRYRPSDLDKFMGFPENGTYHWVRKPYTISRIQDYIRLAAFMDIDFNTCLDYFLLIKTEPIHIPLVLPPKKNRSKNNTLSSIQTFDMLRHLRNINEL